MVAAVSFFFLFLRIVATATFKIIQHLEENSDRDGDFLEKGSKAAH